MIAVNRRRVVFGVLLIAIGFSFWMAFLRVLPDNVRFDRVQQDLYEFNKFMPSTPVHDPWGRTYRKIDLGDLKYVWVSLGVNGYFEGFGGDDIWININKDEWIQRLHRNLVWKYSLLFLLGVQTGWLLRVFMTRRVGGLNEPAR